MVFTCRWLIKVVWAKFRRYMRRDKDGGSVQCVPFIGPFKLNVNCSVNMFYSSFPYYVYFVWLFVRFKSWAGSVVAGPYEATIPVTRRRGDAKPRWSTPAPPLFFLCSLKIPLSMRETTASCSSSAAYCYIGHNSLVLPLVISYHLSLPVLPNAIASAADGVCRNGNIGNSRISIS